MGGLNRYRNVGRRSFLKGISALLTAPILGSSAQGTFAAPLAEPALAHAAHWEQLIYHHHRITNDVNLEAPAHYGIRDQHYKLIYRYDNNPDQLGARPAGADPEWALFDCQEDPHELNNLAQDPACNDIFRKMLSKLDAHMSEIGDIPEHDSTATLAGLKRVGTIRET